jgi:hypothetical protein
MDTAAIGKPLPDDHAAAALWWRICRHLTPSLSAQANRDATLSTTWESKLAKLIGTERAEALQASPWWPALVTAVDQGLQRGWRLEALLSTATSSPPTAAVDQCQATVWRISVALDPRNDAAYDRHASSTSDDVSYANAPTGDETAPATTFDEERALTPSTKVDVAHGQVNEGWLEPDLAVAAMLRDVAGPPEQSDADVTRMLPGLSPGGNARSAENACCRSTSSPWPISASVFPRRGGSTIWPTGSVRTSPTTPDSSPVKDPQAGLTSSTTSGNMASATTK